MQLLKRRFTRWLLTFSLVALAALTIAITVQADSGRQHQRRQGTPTRLGVSGGNETDIVCSGPFCTCCSGTLGSLVEDSQGIQYVLSNYHVFDKFLGAGGPGDPVVQPGLIDTRCGQQRDDVVADVTASVPLNTGPLGSNPLVSEADASIAAVCAGAVLSSGEIRDIGTLSASTVALFVGQLVTKSARTTGQTFGMVSAVDVASLVGYSDQCGNDTNLVASFEGQFRVTPGSFSAGGDSGAQIVEDVGSNPRSVGLLFAGSPTDTIGTPIDTVLTALGTQLGSTLTMVGEQAQDPGTIEGTVSDASTTDPISGATVTVDDIGDSATTNASGFYSIPNVPGGSHDVTVSATDFVSQTKSTTVDGGTSTVDFDLQPATTGNTVKVQCITYEGFGGPGGTKHLRIIIEAVDENGSAVAGAQVSATVTLPDTSTTSPSGTTDTAGLVSFDFKNSANGCYTTDVTNIAAPGAPTFDGTEPVNGFDKGTDASPDPDCADDGSAEGCGETAGSSSMLTRGRGRRPHAAKVKAAVKIKRKHQQSLFLSSDEVVGVGVGAVNGEPVIEVYTKSGNPRSLARIPAELEGVRVRRVITGPFTAGLDCRTTP